MSLFTSSMVRYSRTVSLGIIFSEALSFVMGLTRITPSLTAIFKEVRSCPSTLNPVLPLSVFPSFVLYPIFRKAIKPRQYEMSTSSKATSSFLYNDKKRLRERMLLRSLTPRLFWISSYLPIQSNNDSLRSCFSLSTAKLCCFWAFNISRFRCLHIFSALARTA